MEDKIQVFKNAEFGSVRTIELDGESWFVGKDVATALGYTNPRDALSKRVDAEDKGVANCDTLGGEQQVAVINESGLYSLILSSKLPKAKEFKHWITAEVLPNIRKNGGYMAGQKEMTPEEVVANALVLANNILADRERRIKELDEKNKVLAEENEAAKPKVEYFNALVDKAMLTSFTNTAKELHVKPTVFISYLLDNKYIFRNQSGKLLPYEKGKNDGLFEIKEFINKRNGFASVQTYVTPRGRETFRLLVPMMMAADTSTEAAQ